MLKRQCAFCMTYQLRKGIIFENEFFFSQFDIYPVSPGHALVVPKRHVDSILELRTEEWLDLKPAMQETMAVIEETDLQALYEGLLKAHLSEKSPEFCRKMLTLPYLGKIQDAYNIGINDGEAAGRTVPHSHIHIIPRYFGDVPDAVGGVRHIIPGMGNYKR